MKMRTLPPFDALVAFDTALRHRSHDASGHRARHDPERGQPSSAPAGGLSSARRCSSRSSDGLSATPAGTPSWRAASANCSMAWPTCAAAAAPSVAPARLRVAVGRRWRTTGCYAGCRDFTRAQRRHRGRTRHRRERAAGARGRRRRPDPVAADGDGARDRHRHSGCCSTSRSSRFALHDLLPGGKPAARSERPGRTSPGAQGAAGGRGQGAEWSWPVWFGRLGIERQAARRAALRDARAQPSRRLWKARRRAGAVAAGARCLGRRTAGARAARPVGHAVEQGPCRALAGGVGRRPACANLRRLDRGRGQSDDGEARSAPQRPRTDLRLTKEPCGCRADFDQDGNSFSR